MAEMVLALALALALVLIVPVSNASAFISRFFTANERTNDRLRHLTTRNPGIQAIGSWVHPHRRPPCAGHLEQRKATVR